MKNNIDINRLTYILLILIKKIPLKYIKNLTANI